MLRLLFSFSGRISRAQYWRAFAVLAAISFTVLFGSTFVTRTAPPVTLWVLYAASFLAMACSWMAINVKRAHTTSAGRFAWLPVHPAYSISFFAKASRLRSAK
jgi:uncharacterized membrane protein YhaH (DUF805 family)